MFPKTLSSLGPKTKHWNAIFHAKGPSQENHLSQFVAKVLQYQFNSFKIIQYQGHTSMFKSECQSNTTLPWGQFRH